MNFSKCLLLKMNTKMRMNDMENTLTFYPKSANFDDRIISKEDVIYNIFVFGEEFTHIELTQKRPSAEIGGFKFELNNKTLFCNGKQWQGENLDKQIMIVPRSMLIVHTMALPKESITISNSANSTIAMDSGSFAVIEAKLNDLHEVKEYILRLSSNGEKCYLNNASIDEINAPFKIGDRLIIGKACIEYRPSQLKITGLGSELVFCDTELLEEEFKPEYPADFPEYRRSPRIMLLQPREKVKVNQPESLPEKQK